MFQLYNPNFFIEADGSWIIDNSKRIPTEFPKKTQRITKEFPHNSQRIHKEITKNPTRIPKEFPRFKKYHTCEFSNSLHSLQHLEAKDPFGLVNLEKCGRNIG